MRTGNRHLFVAPAVTALFIATLAAPAASQWHGYPMPNIPRTADGKANLSAPVPKTADGTPDLSGIWMAPRIRVDLAQGLKKGEAVPFSA